MVKYVYDVWGNHRVLNPNGTENISTRFVGNVNPIRYRSYYYDTETGLYYLNARYYDPEVCRFISPDDISYLDPETIGGTNLYAYCNNNPVMNIDPTGQFFVSVIVGAIVGAISYAISEVVSFALTGVWSWSWGEFFGSVIGGAIGGFAGKLLKPLKLVGKLAGAMITGFSSTLIGSGLTYAFGEKTSDDFETILKKSLVSGMFSMLGTSINYKLLPSKSWMLPSKVFEKPTQQLYKSFVDFVKKTMPQISDDLFYGYWDPIYSGYSEYYEKKGIINW